MTIEELKWQKRWVCWKLGKVPGRDKPTKVPYQPNGRKAENDDPSTWSTYAECLAVSTQFSGVGCVLGDGVFGIDIDECCDAVTGKFTPESREIVIALDTYTEFSYSGDGCHILGIGDLDEKYRKNKRKVIVKAIPGCKQIEIKSAGFYFVYTGRHLTKTPAELMTRQAELDSLCEKVAAVTKTSVSVAAPDEAARFAKLWAGDMSDYADNHSVADMALVGILARRFNNNPFLIDQEFCKSGLYREKWDRPDYKWSTIWRVVKDAETVAAFDDEEPLTEDTPTEYLTEQPSPTEDGWCPFGEVSLVGGSSGVGKTSWVLAMLEKIRHGEIVWGHATKPREYRAILHDRSARGFMRTVRHLRLPPESIKRIVRLTPAQQRMDASEVLEASIVENPGVPVWLVEGLDLWCERITKPEFVAPFIDSLQRVATRHNVCIIGTVGSPKQKPDDRYYGRDALFGSASLARKVETIVLIALTDYKDGNSPREYCVMPRNGPEERIYLKWDRAAGALVQCEKPEPVEDEKKTSPAMLRMARNCFHKFKPGDEVIYGADLGAVATFYRWRDQAVLEGRVINRNGKYVLAASGTGCVVSG
jgi:hypothetical protein